MQPPDFEATYPLTSMQQGLLFHTLLSPEASDVYFGQAHWPVVGPFDIPRFQRAWQRVVDRHAILRTSFDWTRPGAPLQRVHHEAPVPFQTLDWRALPPQEQEQGLRTFLLTDRARGFAIDRAPLLRITVIRTGSDEHLVIWSGHHLLVDGRSVDIIVRDVFKIYDALLRDNEPTLAPAIPYSEFVEWVQGSDTAQAPAFWRTTLEGFQTPTRFCSAGAGSSVIATQHCEIHVSHRELRELRLRAREWGVSLNTVITTAWALLCGQYSHSDDVVFGVTVGSGGQGAPLKRTLAGLLINTLPVRVKIDPSCSTASLVQSVRACMKEVQRFASSSLVDVAGVSDLPAGTPLFDSIVVFDNSSLDRLTGRHGTVTLGRFTFEQHSNYPVNLVVQRGPELVLKVTYAPEHLPTSSARLLLEHLHVLLCSMAADSLARVAELDYMSENERHRVTEEWNPRTVEQSGISLEDVCDLTARLHPNRTALVHDGQSVTYGELKTRTEQLARHLRARGIRPEVVVAVMLERSIDLVVSMIAIVKAGGAFLCLDPHGPRERTSVMLHDSRAALVITVPTLANELPSTLSTLYLGDGLPPTTTGTVAHEGADPHRLAYVVYTSGTTGEPKGVAIEHRNLLNLMEWHVAAFDLAADDRVTQIANTAFDASVWEVWPALMRGACIVVPPEHVRTNARLLQAWLIAEEITVTFIPTPLAEALLALDWPGDTPLRVMLVGGDVLHARPSSDVPFRVVNNYGPSEGTVVATSGDVTPRKGESGVPDIGRPISGVQVYVLDAALRPVPIDVPGEICIGGRGVARGYVRRPTETEAAFVRSPFLPRDAGRLYKTGDRGRFDSEGNIHFMGRLDDQVQLRGFRIELGEIESALRTYPGIVQAAVVASEASNQRRLVGYLAAPGRSDISIPELRTYLRVKLPEYMVPSSFVVVNELPLTPNGKINRARLPALPAPLPEQSSSEHRHTPLEESFLTIWKSTLRLDAVGLHDNFFEIGGNSLLAIELLETIRLHLHRDLPLSGFFADPTVAGLTSLCAKSRVAASPGIVVPIQPGGSRPPFFCAAPVLGTVFPYYDLAYLMSADQPFYGLQPLGITDKRSASWTIECIAQRYVEAMRQVQPEGPYYVGGWSFGGLVAFEMAYQLTTAGEDVALVLVLDTPAPGLHARLRPQQTFRMFAETVLGSAWGYLRDYEYLAESSKRAATSASARSRRARWSALLGLAHTFVDRATIARVVPQESRLLVYHLPTVREMISLCRRGIVSTLHYRPHTYHGSVTLLRTDQHHAEGNHSALLGWDTVSTGAVEVRPIPGNHLTLLRHPHIRTVAEVMQRALDARRPESDDDRSTSDTAAQDAISAIA